MSSEREMRRHARDGGSRAQALQGWGMLLGGSALAVYAVTRRRPSIALAVCAKVAAFNRQRAEKQGKTESAAAMRRFCFPVILATRGLSEGRGKTRRRAATEMGI